ncbi:MAG: hypothetical protein ACI4XF_04440 [Oscillospiraceae bacterium]
MIYSNIPVGDEDGLTVGAAAAELHRIYRIYGRSFPLRMEHLLW